MTIRPEVVESLICGGPPPPDATEDEFAAALEHMELRVAEADAQLAEAEAGLAAFELADARDYRRWRAGRRAWVSEYGRRPVTPTGRTGP